MGTSASVTAGSSKKFSIKNQNKNTKEIAILPVEGKKNEAVRKLSGSSRNDSKKEQSDTNSAGSRAEEKKNESSSASQLDNILNFVGKDEEEKTTDTIWTEATIAGQMLVDSK
jgi:hypothetical protein